MIEEEKWNYLIQLDSELLIGGTIVSEWCAFIVREADIAFVKGACLASILTAVSGIETYLRAEYSEGKTLFELIETCSLSNDLKFDLHRLRKYRNKWVHVDAPHEDHDLLENPEMYGLELEQMAVFAARTLRKTIYSSQCL